MFCSCFCIPHSSFCFYVETCFGPRAGRVAGRNFAHATRARASGSTNCNSSSRAGPSRARAASAAGQNPSVRAATAEESLRELADSIREQGIVQPLIVRERGEFFELIAGERRWRAAQLLHLPEVPVITREADDRSVLELALIENLQRENLNAIEEAHGYAQLAEQFQLTQEEIALKVGKSRAAVANSLRLIKLPETIQKYVREERISVGHAKVILGLTDEKSQKLAAERVIKEGLNVRQTEGLVAKLQKRAGKSVTQPETVARPAGDPHVADLEAKLREVFATKVKLNYALGKGSLEISFFSDAELERILQILGINAD